MVAGPPSRWPLRTQFANLSKGQQSGVCVRVWVGGCGCVETRVVVAQEEFWAWALSSLCVCDSSEAELRHYE